MPVLTAAVEGLTAEPRSEEIEAGRAPTTRYCPGAGRAWPTVVVLNGATALGRAHPRVVRLARALARAGHVVLVPDVPGLVRFEVTEEGLASTVAVAEQAAAGAGGKVALFGVSAGTTLALLAAEEPELAGRVSVVAGLAGFTDLADLIRLATTGVCRQGDSLRPYEAGPFLALCVGRSVVAGLEPGPDRNALAAELAAVEADDPDPLARLRAQGRGRLSEQARASVELLANRDPERFDELYAALPPEVRQKVDRLSPVVRAERLRVPVELLCDPQDKYFPLEHSLALQRGAPSVRLTATRLLEHADARLSPGMLGEATKVFGFVARALRKARFG